MRTPGRKPNTNSSKPSSKSGSGRTAAGRPKSDKPVSNFKPKSGASRPAKTAKPKAESDEIRLNKYISNSGQCSRRDADIYIQSGNVKVNGQVILEMGYKVKPGDVVQFDGSVISPEKKVYVLLNKPKNFSTSGDGDSDQRNVAELVRTASTSVLKPIGRMDKNTTGLLLFTNDNDLLVKLNKPGQKSPKIYHVSLDRNLKFEDLEKISGGVTLDEHRLYVDEISYVEGADKTEIGIQLRTANVKVVRAIFEQFKYNVLRIDRVSFAGLTKKDLPRGNWRHLTDQEVINLKHF